MTAITDIESFNHLCRLCGIIDDYYDIRGQHHVAGFEAKLSLLESMGINVEIDDDIYAQIEKIDRRDWLTIVPPVLVCSQEETPVSILLNLTSTQLGQPVQWQITEESGKTHSGEWQFEAQLATDQREFDNVLYYRFYNDLPEIETGYHQLNIATADATATTTSLIVTPATSYQPQVFEAGCKVWGVNLQLYALRSRRNWGIGDFTDLQSVTDTLAPLGVDLIGLNPLHTLFAHLPENASPYSPSSRRFINPLYIDIESVDEFKRSDEATRLVNSLEFQQRLQSLRDAELIRYSDIWQIKSSVFRLIYRQFLQDLEDTSLESTRQFRQFQVAGGDELRRFSIFEALQERFYEQDAVIEHWQDWPDEYRDPDSAAVEKWVRSNIEAVEYHQYLQFRAEQQWSQAARRSRQVGMSIGLYGDLAVGNERFSSACWGEQSDYADGATIGAPPDDFNPSGQDWGLPPLLPQQLKTHQYRTFIQTLRANMRYTGALRIDHVMALMRLYWVPHNYPADQGIYVSYPFEDLLGILCLESQRNHCLIIGEDLGTVPDEVRHQLWHKKIFSYRVLVFEKDWNQGSYRLPHEYPVYSLCTTGSHDMPTLESYWRGTDIDLCDSLNLYPTRELKQQLIDSRNEDRYQIKSALLREGLIDENTLHGESTNEISNEFFLSIQRFLARSQSLVMTVQLEDLLSQCEQVNIPGTIDEYPNWRHKISLPVEDWLETTKIRSICHAIGREREQ